MVPTAARLFRFGPFELDVRSGELRKHGIRIKLREQPVRILLMMLDTPGEVVLRDEIRRRLWPNNTQVEFDHGINAAIQKLRDALGESAGSPRYVETVARRGYRFLGEVERVPDPAIASQPEPPCQPEPPIRETPASSNLDGQLLSHYRIRGKLGEGGMGVVYRAEDLKLGRSVALKFLPGRPGDWPESILRRFEREAQAASALNHPNICTIYGLEDFNGHPAIVMELVEGETLAARLANGPLPLDQALRMSVQVAAALAEAHHKGVTHRDLKPGNLMLTKSGIKVLDFGLAKMEKPLAGSTGDHAETLTERGALVGTVDYMSPEQLEGKDADARSDIFAFGLVLYEMITGKRAFGAPSRAGTIAAILERDPPAIEPEVLNRVVRACLAKDPAERFQSARDLQRALEWGTAGYSSNAAQAEADMAVWRPGNRWRISALVAMAAVTALAVATFLARPVPLDLSAYKFTPLDTDREVKRVASWSPDGKSIAYLKSEAGSALDGKWQVMFRSLDSPSPVQLTRQPDGAVLTPPFFSQDGAEVYYIASRALWSVSVVGGEPREVLRAPMAAAALSPDGKTLAFWRAYREDDRTYGGVWISSPPGTPPRKYNPAPFRMTGNYLPVFLRFSPDGSKIGLSHYRVPGESWMWSLPWPDGPAARPQQVFSDRRWQSVSPFDWMPDSRHLCISFDRGLWVGDVHTGGLQRLTASATGDTEQPAVSLEGKRIVYSASTTDYDIVDFPLDGSPPRTVLATAEAEFSPSWSASGDLMAFVTNRGGDYQIWLRSANGNWERPVVRQADFPQDRGRMFSAAALSPDATRLAYYRHGALWISPASGGRALPAVVGAGHQDSGASWSPDSSSIAYLSASGGKQWVAVTRVGSQQAEFLVPGSENQCTSPPIWSPDGRWIVCGWQQSLLVVSPDGGERRFLSSPVPASQGSSVIVWSREAETIYLASSLTSRARLDAINVRTGNSRRIAEYEDVIFYSGGLHMSYGSLSHDGKSFATSVVKRKSDLWMLEGFPQPGRRWF